MAGRLGIDKLVERSLEGGVEAHLVDGEGGVVGGDGRGAHVDGEAHSDEDEDEGKRERLSW